MKKYSILIVASLTLLSLGSCAALSRYKCNPEYAAKKGMEDADAGRTSQPSRAEGSSCEGEYTASTFSKDYNQGFQKRKAEICQLGNAAGFGRKDGEEGNTNKPQKGKLALCNDMKDYRKLEAAYENEFRKSLCAPARASSVGTARARAWQAADFETAFADCKGAPNLKKAYMDAHRAAMASNCTVTEAEKSGVAEATARRPAAPVLDRLNQCDGSNRERIKSAFEASYKATSEKLAKEDSDRAAAEQARVREMKTAEFNRTTAQVVFGFNGKNYIARCSLPADRSYIQVEVENSNPEQALIQGNWRMVYYNDDFAKITEDRSQEAILVTANNRKSFQKMTLPRGAAHCRAEFLGVN